MPNPTAPAPEAGRELDRLIAERIFGHTVYQKNAKAVYGWVYDTGKPFMQYPACSEADAWRLASHYSTDVATAWEIVERIGGYFLLQHLVRTDRFGFHPLTWYCAFAAPRRFEVTADTASLAICRAALAMTTTEDDR